MGMVTYFDYFWKVGQIFRLAICECPVQVSHDIAEAFTVHRCGHPLDMVWTIWATFREAYRGCLLPNPIIKNVDQCISMSNAALRYGCDIKNSIAYNPLLPNPLFTLMNDWNIGKAQSIMDAIRYLCSIGYDMEERNSKGETLYLYGATLISPSVITSLKFLIEIGADTSAMDLHNCSALHLALMPPRHCYHWGAWGSSYTDNYNHDGYGDEMWASQMFLTESESYAEDYCNHGLTPAPSTIDDFQSDRLACDARSQERLHRASGGNFPMTDSMRSGSHIPSSRHEQYIDLDETDDDNENEEIDVEDEDEDEDEEGVSGEDSSDEEDHEIDEYNDTEDLEVPEGYVLCYDPDERRTRIIQRPLPILKTRLRFKLLALLRAGCDPNVLDNKGNSPSDDARYHGLWPEWTWALLNAGYVFDADGNRWVKRLEEEVSSC